MNFKALCACFVSLAISSSAIGMEIERSSLMASKKLGNVRLFHKNNKFVVERDGKERGIQPYLVSPTLRSMSRDHLEGFLHNGYVQLKELRDEKGKVDYKLDAYGRLKGGGPVSGFIAYWATKAVGYGAIPAVVGANATIAHRAATASGLGRGSSLALGTGAAVATTATISANPFTIVAVESAATSVSAFFALLPFLP